MNALLTVRSEMLPFSLQEISKTSKCSESPKHFAIGYVHNDILPRGNIALQYIHVHVRHSQQLQEGLMVFSDDFLHFLKVKKKMVEFTKTILWL